MKFSHDYYVYILLCSDGTYYTGMTNSMDRRLGSIRRVLILHVIRLREDH